MRACTCVGIRVSDGCQDLGTNMAASSNETDGDPDQLQSVSGLPHFRRTGNKYRCWLCRSACRTFSGFKRHLRVHGVVCPMCQKLFSSEKQQKKHIKTNHLSARGYKCPRCPSIFPTLHSFWGHSRAHGSLSKPDPSLDQSTVPKVKRKRTQKPAQKPAAKVEKRRQKQCKKCGKIIAHLAAHMNLHRGLRPFKCSVCPKDYPCQSSLVRHKKQCHGYGMLAHKDMPPSVTDPDPEPVSEPVAPEPVSEPDPEPVSEPDPEPVSDPMLESEPDPLSAPNNLEMVVSIPVRVSVACHPTSDMSDRDASIPTPPVATEHAQEQDSVCTPVANSNNPLSCGVCGRVYSCRQSLRRHHRAKHGRSALPVHPGPTTPYHCGSYTLPLQCRTLASTAVFDPSSNSESDCSISRLSDPTYRCGCCDKILPSLDAYKGHLFSHTGAKCYLCGTCGRDYSSASTLWLHQRRKHSQYRKKACARTGGGVSQLLKLSKFHQQSRKNRRKEKSRLLSCHKCPKQFTSPSDLGRHLRVTHNSIDPNTSRTAIESSSSTHDLADSPHSSPPPPSLTEHVNGTTATWPLVVPYDTKTGLGYKCILCSKVLTRLSYYKNHMNLHTGECPYPCKLCEKRFPNHSTRDRHMVRTHLGRRAKTLSPRQTSVTHSNHTLSQEMERSSIAEQPELPGEETATPTPTLSPPKAHDTPPPSPSRLSVEGRTDPSFSCGVCGATVESCSSYMDHMNQHHSSSPSLSPSAGRENQKIAHRMSLRRSGEGVSGGGGGGRGSKRSVCQLCGKSYKRLCDLRKHLHFKHPPPRLRPKMKLRGIEQLVDAVSPDTTGGGEDLSCEGVGEGEGEGGEVEGGEVEGVGGGLCKVLPVCGEVLVEEVGMEDTLTHHHDTSSQISDTVYKKYGPWNVFFFNNTT